MKQINGLILIYAMVTMVIVGLTIVSYYEFTHKNFPEALVALLVILILIASGVWVKVESKKVTIKQF